jgi:NADH:ubiquinone oxidoreductase subunit F (NADH-binding)
MSMYHIKMDKIKTDEAKPFGWTVFNFDTIAEMKAFQEQVNELYRQMSDKNTGIKTVGITGEVKA